jgi:C_GCAxxG_C_C family probable redox protein
MTHPDLEKYAADMGGKLHAQGFNCAECVVLAISNWKEWKHKAIPRIATGFGGGIGRTANLCGAATGALMGIGLAYGRDSGDNKDAQNFAYRLARRFLDDFQAQNGSINCRDIAKVNFDDPKDVKRWMDEGGRDRCGQVIINTISSALLFMDNESKL